MRTDPIIEEIHKERETHAAKFGHDLQAIFNDLKRVERELGIAPVSLPARPPLQRRSAA
jgi:hypothetical protein